MRSTIRPFRTCSRGTEVGAEALMMHVSFLPSCRLKLVGCVGLFCHPLKTLAWPGFRLCRR